jgi:hypothetical protein
MNAIDKGSMNIEQRFSEIMKLLKKPVNVLPDNVLTTVVATAYALPDDRRDKIMAKLDKRFLEKATIVTEYGVIVERGNPLHPHVLDRGGRAVMRYLVGVYSNPDGNHSTMVYFREDKEGMKCGSSGYTTMSSRSVH